MPKRDFRTEVVRGGIIQPGGQKTVPFRRPPVATPVPPKEELWVTEPQPLVQNEENVIDAPLLEVEVIEVEKDDLVKEDKEVLSYLPKETFKKTFKESVEEVSNPPPEEIVEELPKKVAPKVAKDTPKSAKKSRRKKRSK